MPSLLLHVYFFKQFNFSKHTWCFMYHVICKWLLDLFILKANMKYSKLMGISVPSVRKIQDWFIQSGFNVEVMYMVIVSRVKLVYGPCCVGLHYYFTKPKLLGCVWNYNSSKPTESRRPAVSYHPSSFVFFSWLPIILQVQEKTKSWICAGRSTWYQERMKGNKK